MDSLPMDATRFLLCDLLARKFMNPNRKSLLRYYYWKLWEEGAQGKVHKQISTCCDLRDPLIDPRDGQLAFVFQRVFDEFRVGEWRLFGPVWDRWKKIVITPMT